MNNEFPYGGQSKVDNFAYGYNYLKNVLKVKTVIKNPYKEVLKNSHEKLLAAAENWIK
jgi:hypothetical protein